MRKEISFKQWCMEGAEQLGISYRSFVDRLYCQATIQRPPVRRENARVMWVRAGTPVRPGPLAARPGEVRLKEWIKRECAATGLNYKAVWERFHRWPLERLGLKGVRRMNRAVVFVRAGGRRGKGGELI